MTEPTLPFPKPRDESVSGRVARRLQALRVPFTANDCIADHIADDELPAIEAEVAERMQGVLSALVIDTENDPNTKETARRVAKMFCREVFRGRFEQAPKLTLFPNTKKLDELYTTGPITIRSTCSHHLCPIIGRAWVGVIPNGQVAGLSKFNRMVDWICSRPQIQEEMAMQVADYLEQQVQPKGLAVVIKATHTCMTHRGVREGTDSVMTNSVMRGVFRENPAARAEFFELIKE